MSMRTYTIKCNQCKAERQVQIHSTPMGDRIDWLETPDNAYHPIASGRKRLDDHWGWQCRCGNNDLMTRQERNVFVDPAKPKPQEIDEIVKNLKVDQPKFEMAEV